MSRAPHFTCTAKVMWCETNEKKKKNESRNPSQDFTRKRWTRTTRSQTDFFSQFEIRSILSVCGVVLSFRSRPIQTLTNVCKKTKPIWSYIFLSLYLFSILSVRWTTKWRFCVFVDGEEWNLLVGFLHMDKDWPINFCCFLYLSLFHSDQYQKVPLKVSTVRNISNDNACHRLTTASNFSGTGNSFSSTTASVYTKASNSIKSDNNDNRSNANEQQYQGVGTHPRLSRQHKTYVKRLFTIGVGVQHYGSLHSRFFRHQNQSPVATSNASEALITSKTVTYPSSSVGVAWTSRLGNSSSGLSASLRERTHPMARLTSTSTLDDKTNRKNHRCDVIGCNKVYTKSSHLKAHKRTHTGWFTLSW